MAGVLTPVGRRPGVQRVDDTGAVGVLLRCSAKVLCPVRLCLGGSARASMVLLQLFALVRVVGLRVRVKEVDSDQALPRGAQSDAECSAVADPWQMVPQTSLPSLLVHAHKALASSLTLGRP